MTDTAYVSDVRRAVRRSLFQRLKGMNLSQDQVTRLVATGAAAAIDNAAVKDLAAVAAASGPLAAALAAVAPTNPALADFVAVRDNAHDSVRDLATYEP